MLNSLIVVVILVVSIPTVGYIAAGTVCFLMGLANVPGYRIWRSGVTRLVQGGIKSYNPSDSDNWQGALRVTRQAQLAVRFGMFLAWVGQSVVSLCFAAVLIQLAKLFFGHFEVWFLFRWLYWVGLFFLCLSPSYRSLRVAEESYQNGNEKLFYRFTLSLTCIMTALCFTVLACI
jgi:hypothetical protein